MHEPVAIIGMGEMGELFARGFLKLGHPVYPVLRGISMADAARTVPEPELVIVAVGEDDLDAVLAAVPAAWGNRLALLQNELLPHAWERHAIANPTVIVVWFDKKKGRPFVAVLPTPVAGPQAHRVSQALQAVDVPCYPIAPTELLFELVKKNLYILTINIAGLRLRQFATVGELWRDHRALAEAVAHEILDIQEWLAGTPLPRERLLEGMLKGFDGDPDHICTGRTAPKRLRRALATARTAGLAVPTLTAIERDVFAPTRPETLNRTG